MSLFDSEFSKINKKFSQSNDEDNGSLLFFNKVHFTEEILFTEMDINKEYFIVGLGYKKEQQYCNHKGKIITYNIASY